MIRENCWLAAIKFIVLAMLSLGLLNTTSSHAEDGPTEESLEIGRQLGALMEHLLSGGGKETEPAAEPTTPPAPFATATPGPYRGDCPEGQYLLWNGICIGKNRPLRPNHPRDFEFKVCFKFRGSLFCAPGYLECVTTADGKKTCTLKVITPPFIPNVECHFSESPDGGTDVHCTHPGQYQPLERKVTPGHITYPGDGKGCFTRQGERTPNCFEPDDIKKIPFAPELLPKLPGYPIGEPGYAMPNPESSTAKHSSASAPETVQW